MKKHLKRKADVTTCDHIVSEKIEGGDRKRFRDQMNHE